MIVHDERHVGTFGRIWFKHAWSVEEFYSEDDDVTLWRMTCRCGARGKWRWHDVVATADGETHQSNGDMAWNQNWKQRGLDDPELPPGWEYAVGIAVFLIAVVVFLTLVVFPHVLSRVRLREAPRGHETVQKMWTTQEDQSWHNVPMLHPGDGRVET